MRKILKPTVMVVVVVVLVIVKLSSAEKTKAAGQNVFGACVSQVPQAWGEFKGGSQQTGLAFEDTHGTLRFITNIPCNSATPAVALEIRRTPGH